MIRPPFRTLSTHIAALVGAMLVLGAPSAARADRADRPHAEEYRGIYFAGGLGGGLQLAAVGGDVAAGQGELRIGYSLGRRFQIYLDANFGAGSQSFGMLTASDVMVGLRYFLYADPFLGVYARGSLGLGIVNGIGAVTTDGSSSEFGIAESYAIGVEFRLGGPWALSPEVFYRRTNETSDVRVDMLGVGLLINFN
jgi:hypothetical protein